MIEIEDITSPDIVKQVSKVVANYSSTGELPEQKELASLADAYKKHLQYQETSSLLTKLTTAYTERYGAK